MISLLKKIYRKGREEQKRNTKEYLFIRMNKAVSKKSTLFLFEKSLFPSRSLFFPLRSLRYRSFCLCKQKGRGWRRALMGQALLDTLCRD